MMSEFRYTYLGDRHTAPELKGMQCDPVKNERGKCICSRLGTMLVVDANGQQFNVIRRMLRRNDKMKTYFHLSKKG